MWRMPWRAIVCLQLYSALRVWVAIYYLSGQFAERRTAPLLITKLHLAFDKSISVMVGKIARRFLYFNFTTSIGDGLAKLFEAFFKMKNILHAQRFWEFLMLDDSCQKWTCTWHHASNCRHQQSISKITTTKISPTGNGVTWTLS